MATLGIDFGTSNSAAGYWDGTAPRLIEVSRGNRTLPTSFFFDFDTRQTLIGDPANAALLDGREGRFMRALKRVLGTSLMREKRQILNERVTFVDIIARFLAHLKAQAEAETGEVFTRVVSGRPVVFHKQGDAREAQAEADLRECYLAAGFKDVRFLFEPEAAALAADGPSKEGAISLVVDIGGGTSDFSLFRTANASTQILANHGVRIGGTDFDRSISIECVMPLLGKGGQVRNVIGAGHAPVPNAIFNDLATWEKIPFVYTGQNTRMVADLIRLSETPKGLRRLSEVLEHQLGHDLAFAVEDGKIAANDQGEAARIALDVVEPGLVAKLTPNMVLSILDGFGQSIAEGAQETLRLGSVETKDVDQIVYVGGSSLMSIVSDTMKGVFPEADHHFTEVFTAVAKGLSIAARDG